MILRIPVLALASAALLVGCSAAPDPVPTVTPEPTATQVVLPAPALGEVGSGTLADVPFTVNWDGENFAILGLDGLDRSRGAYVFVTADPVAQGACLDHVYTLPFGLEGFPPEMGLPIEGSLSSADATYLHGVSQVGEHTESCWTPVVAASTITWSMTPLYSDLQVIDSGDTGGARGTVTLDGTEPVAYLVHQGDVFAEVAARFGISEAQLFWLNPRRQDAGAPSLLTDETLNLSPTRR